MQKLICLTKTQKLCSISWNNDAGNQNVYFNFKIAMKTACPLFYVMTLLVPCKGGNVDDVLLNCSCQQGAENHSVKKSVSHLLQLSPSTHSDVLSTTNLNQS